MQESVRRPVPLGQRLVVGAVGIVCLVLTIYGGVVLVTGPFSWLVLLLVIGGAVAALDCLLAAFGSGGWPESPRWIADLFT